MNFRRLQLVAVMAISFVLTACANHAPDPNLVAAANRPIMCVAGTDCEQKWSRAVQWVISNSSWKIQLQTDQMIQTFGPEKYSPASAFVVTKAANTLGYYTINFSSACDNILGCVPSALELKASFNNAVLGPVSASQAPQAYGVAPGTPHFGIKVITLPADNASPTAAMGARGLMVIGVETGSIAERAGMMTGDILYSLDGKAMNAVQDLPQAMASVSPGSNISVKVSRGQNPVELHAQF